MNWGNKLVLALLVFATIMATMVTLAMKQNIDLVDKDYYKKELAYQDQIDKIKNTVKNEAVKMNIRKDLPIIELQFRQEVQIGEIHLFRPSNAKEDRKIELKTDNSGLVQIPYTELNTGLWRIKIDWVESNEEYYFESQINIP